MSYGDTEHNIDARCEFCRKPLFDMEPTCGHLVTLFETGWEYCETTGVDVPSDTPEALIRALKELFSEINGFGEEIIRVFDLWNIERFEDLSVIMPPVCDRVREDTRLERTPQRKGIRGSRKRQEEHRLDWFSRDLDEFVTELPDGTSTERIGGLVEDRLSLAIANCPTAVTGYRDIERGFPGFGSSVTYVWGKPRMKSVGVIAGALRRDARAVRALTKRVAKLPVVKILP